MLKLNYIVVVLYCLLYCSPLLLAVLPNSALQNIFRSERQSIPGQAPGQTGPWTGAWTALTALTAPWTLKICSPLAETPLRSIRSVRPGPSWPVGSVRCASPAADRPGGEGRYNFSMRTKEKIWISIDNTLRTPRILHNRCLYINIFLYFLFFPIIVHTAFIEYMDREG